MNAFDSKGRLHGFCQINHNQYSEIGEYSHGDKVGLWRYIFHYKKTLLNPEITTEKMYVKGFSYGPERDYSGRREDNLLWGVVFSINDVVEGEDICYEVNDPTRKS